MIIIMALQALTPAKKAEVERAVAAELVDPESARFRWMPQRGSTICGYVNSKNRLGGYIGFTVFAYREPSLGVGAPEIAVGNEENGFGETAFQICANAGYAF